MLVNSLTDCNMNGYTAQSLSVPNSCLTASPKLHAQGQLTNFRGKECAQYQKSLPLRITYCSCDTALIDATTTCWEYQRQLVRVAALGFRFPDFKMWISRSLEWYIPSLTQLHMFCFMEQELLLWKVRGPVELQLQSSSLSECLFLLGSKNFN